METVGITLDQVKLIVAEILQLGARADAFTRSTPLLGSVPEFDSMAVVSVITALEDNYGIVIEDDELTAEVFATLGDLQDFVNQKMAS
ncbi:acyl carrier protein [Aestuariicella hydrocarbonica]|uniref:Acyl carrier protein n=1 Tax=Pseudomaricurvus hydrocarbonicus TaxID=1470433 RepID=A0A9E5MGH7_9GAMM|nr:acyl carrier protein [Aestuariicella hydrocarbonica]NHO64686.1 acyl carrier protein [Aestuariicella hydrocarbonica]